MLASDNNKRIAKNTLLLYIRMIVTTLVSLFTARLTLQLLGVEDYGINNVVGGIVGFVGIVTGTMTSASQRFLAYHLGNNDMVQFKNTFCMLMNMFALFCLLVIMILELIAPFLLHELLVIPEDRIYAASWVYQFSLMSFCLSTMLIPYSAAIVSHEKMGIYAYFTFVDVFMKLMVVYALYVTPFDRLITIGGLSVVSMFIVFLINYLYCRIKLSGCTYCFFWKSSLFKEVASFAGWNLWGSTTTVMNHQGQAVLLNMFFGPVVNTAKAIADKINQVIYSFCQNFFMAMNPQIIKSYASGNVDYTRSLVLNSSKFSFLLYSLIAIPVIFNMEDLLSLWLGADQVSDDMVLFSQLILVLSFTNNLESPITQVVRATGDIRKYQVVIGCQTLLFLPVTYVAFKWFGAPAYFSMIILCAIYVVALFFRFSFLKKILKIEFRTYWRKVIFPLLLVLIFSGGILWAIHLLNWCDLCLRLLRIVIDLFAVCLIILFIGVSKKERLSIAKVLEKYIKTRK